MAERMFGLETEYALSVLGPLQDRVDQQRAVSGFVELAHKELPHLGAMYSSGVFLQNGSRLYIDSGAHPELATPELVNPWDACRYVLAGDRMLAQLAEHMQRHGRWAGHVIITRCNVCYSPGATTTWGCHECYCHQADLSALPEELIPHLVSRVVYTGSGGFDNRSPGVQFMLSPRVAHLEQVVSGASMHNRGIYHCKNESLSRPGFHRLHVLCGESVCSQTALWLKTAITTLVVAMTEAGLTPCRAIRLRDPLGAMRRFAADVECTAQVQSEDGKPWTAIQMQRHILTQIESHADHPIMPPWTREACDRLREVLDRLEKGNVAKMLDWAIKLSLYQELAHRRGISWQSLPRWNRVLTQSGIVWAPGSDTSRLVPLIKSNGLDSDQLESVLRLRQELFNLETRFAQLGEQGVFNALDRPGVLEHRVPGVNNIEHAVANPPAVGRAHLRGQCVQQFHNQAADYSCDWFGVWDHRRGRFLDLSDPFAAEEKWQEGAAGEMLGLGDPFGLPIHAPSRLPHLRGLRRRAAAPPPDSIFRPG